MKLKMLMLMIVHRRRIFSKTYLIIPVAILFVRDLKKFKLERMNITRMNRTRKNEMNRKIFKF